MKRLLNTHILEILTKVFFKHLGGNGTKMLTVLNSGEISAQDIPTGGSGTSGLPDTATNGIVTRTAANTTVARTITGTTNLIVVTNGDGVLGDPVINVGSQVATTSNTINLTNKTLGAGTKINLGTVASGDMYYGGLDGSLVRVPRGTDGQVWTLVGGVPAWSPSTGGSGSSTSYFSSLDFAGSNTAADPIRLKNGNGFADPGSSGLLVRTIENTVVPVTILGETSRILITNGDGTSGHPTIKIGTDIVTLSQSQTLSNKTLTSPKINVGSDATGDMYYRSSTGAFVRIPAGSADTILKMGLSSVPSWQPISSLLNTWKIIQRNITTGRVSTTTLAPDEQLKTSLLSGYIYTIRLTVHFSANGGNFKFGFTGPTATVRATYRGVVNGSTTHGHLSSYELSGQGLTSSSNSTLYLDVVVEPTASGEFAFTWAQTVSNTGPTNVHIGSILEVFTGSNLL